MARHSARVRRLTAQATGIHADLAAARATRMPDEELEAKLMQSAVQLGFDVDQANVDPEALNLWTGGHVPEWAQALSEEELAHHRHRLAVLLDWRSQPRGGSTIVGAGGA